MRVQYQILVVSMHSVYKTAMDLRSLRYFAEIAETENFSRAAVRLRRSQPALSRCMQELESELGLKLFERIGRRAALTANGRALLGRVRLLLKDVEGIAEQARLLAAGKTSILRLGGAANFMEQVLPAVLRRYQARWPQVEVMLEPAGGSALLAGLERGEIDVALTRYAESSFLQAEPAFPLYVLAAVPRKHRLARQASVTIHDLEKERILVAPSSVTSRRLFESACQECDVRLRIALESHELNSLVALAEAGQGVAVIPSTVDVRQRAVVSLPVHHHGKPLAFWTALVWDRRREQPEYATAFVREACAYLGKNYPGRHLDLPLPERGAQSILLST
jgi:DNA-binding transcriptional LysR family regulator